MQVKIAEQVLKPMFARVMMYESRCIHDIHLSFIVTIVVKGFVAV
jgi:hypothetical protein